MVEPTDAHYQPDDRPVDEQLADLRVRIGALDGELLNLLNARARLAQAVGEVKKLDGSTTAMTFTLTLDSDNLPTALTRTS